MKFKYHVSGFGHAGDLMLNAMAHDDYVHGLVPVDVDVYLIGPVVAYPVVVGTTHGRSPSINDRGTGFILEERYIARWIGMPRARRLRRLLAG